jgi:porin
LPGRPDDILGVAVARSWFSADYSAAQTSAETVIEATWRAHICAGWTLQPDVQYIFSPGGQKSADALILGLRTTVVF